MNATATEELCRRCGAILSRYREPGETLCAPCAARQRDAQPPARVLEPEALVDVIAGVLLIARGLHPGRRVHIRRQLRRLGVEADHVDIFQACQKLRRRYGWDIGADERQPGHVLRDWPYRFRRERSPQLRLFRYRHRQPELFKCGAP